MKDLEKALGVAGVTVLFMSLLTWSAAHLTGAPLDIVFKHVVVFVLGALGVAGFVGFMTGLFGR